MEQNKLSYHKFPITNEIYSLESLLEVVEADINREMLKNYNMNELRGHLLSMDLGTRLNFFTDDNQLRFVLTKNEEDNYEVILVQPFIKNDRLMCTGIDSDNVNGGYGFMANGANSMVGATKVEIARCLSRVLRTKGIFKI